MKLTRLRIAGFKTFVDPVEFLIEPGLTGVVGPNGCGKSNLVEALRWVMGESSFKNMRASGMDDVIFSGSGKRPSRNHAEVQLTIDNADRTAPAAFNDAEVLDVSRKIQREAGSTYRINGREVRARDVQLLFADAATGARSPALVRQGQIAEIIAAKPQARRRILEDAAGIGGLHARRHEAELKLRQAEDNLARLDDILREIDGQGDNLRRQAKQAARYRALSAQVRQHEALIAAAGWAQARREADEANRVEEAAVRLVAERMAAQGEAARAQAVAAHHLPRLREDEAAAGAALQKLTRTRDALFAEERRAKEREEELSRRIAEIGRDMEREAQGAADAAQTLARLAEEAASLSGMTQSAEALALAQRDRAAADAGLAEAETAFAQLQGEIADLKARRAALLRSEAEAGQRLARAGADLDRVRRDLAAATAGVDAAAALAALQDEVRRAQDEAGRADDAAAAARTLLAAARDGEARARPALHEAERDAQRLDTEIRTLKKLLAPAGAGRFTPVLDLVQAGKGYETALAAALGDDLDAALDEAAPLRWLAMAPADDPPLPAGAVPLADQVEGPSVLSRRLAQTGVVARADGLRLQAGLRPGQVLVSRDGDVWRWDGLVAAAEAPSPAARRLTERNRLGELETDAARAASVVAAQRLSFAGAQHSARQATQAEAAAVDDQRLARRVLDGLRERLSTAERRAGEQRLRIGTLEEARLRLAAAETEARAALAAAETALAAFAPADALDARLAGSRAAVTERREAAARARAALETLTRERDMRASRLAAIARDRAAWQDRAQRATATTAELAGRREAAQTERRALEEAPGALAERRRQLAIGIAEAQGERKAAADRLAEAENAATLADKAARAALDALSEAREARAGAQARNEAARERLDAAARQIGETYERPPDALFREAGLSLDAPAPDLAQVERRLSELRGERERLGAVNLRAEEELKEVEDKRHGLVTERDDLTEAIRRLRTAIGSLNREGRERLLAAFQSVDAQFRRLFTHLFGGGTAELSLVDAQDPLEAGLEIFARPPGKKPSTMTLLSGGEQALTAIALIFAVFLTNPSPICVLDEVDAPLDDANVERYCDLLDEMARETDTRFLVITHNPITMARMSRLFGVTMAERGVSELVSVDLEDAERLREAS